MRDLKDDKMPGAEAAILLRSENPPTSLYTSKQTGTEQ